MEKVIILSVIGREYSRPVSMWPPREKLTPLFVSGGADMLLCGWCRFTIGDSVDFDELRSTLLVCPRCGSENLGA